MGRRTFLKVAGSLGLLGFAVPGRLEALLAAAPGPGQPGRFLDAHELDTLRAVTGRFVPGPPDDHDPGAVEAGAAEAIDLLLATFTFDPPLIHAGGPFSNRAGAGHDDFADFIALDPPSTVSCPPSPADPPRDTRRGWAGPATSGAERWPSRRSSSSGRAPAAAPPPGPCASPVTRS